MIFAFTAWRAQNIAKQNQPKVNTRSVFTPDEIDDETRELIGTLERDLRSGVIEPDGVACPVCGNRMAEMTVKGITLDACPRCLAAWFDPGELSQLLAIDKDVPGAGYRSRASRYDCPRCEGSMREYAFVNPFNLLVDRCQDCGGVLLENGELERAAELRGKA